MRISPRLVGLAGGLGLAAIVAGDFLLRPSSEEFTPSVQSAYVATEKPVAPVIAETPALTTRSSVPEETSPVISSPVLTQNAPLALDLPMLRGYVVDSAEQRIDHPRVRLFQNNTLLSDVTSTDGNSFAIPLPTNVSSSYRIEILRPPYIPETHACDTLSLDTPNVIHLEKGRTLEVIVQDAAGTRVPDATVTLLDPYQFYVPFSVYNPETTDAQGTAQFHGLNPNHAGKYTHHFTQTYVLDVTPKDPSQKLFPSDVTEIFFGDDQQTIQKTVTLIPGYTLSVHVTPPNIPLDVSLRSASYVEHSPLHIHRQLCAAPSSFTLDHLIPGPYFLEIVTPDQTQSKRMLIDIKGDMEQSLALSNIITYTGQVMDELGRPLTANLFLKPEDGTPTLMAKTDARGYFTLDAEPKPMSFHAVPQPFTGADAQGPWNYEQTDFRRIVIPVEVPRFSILAYDATTRSPLPFNISYKEQVGERQSRFHQMKSDTGTLEFKLGAGGKAYLTADGYEKVTLDIAQPQAYTAYFQKKK